MTMTTTAGDYTRQAEGELLAGERFNEKGHVDSEQRCYIRAAVFALLAIASAVDDVQRRVSELPRER